MTEFRATLERLCELAQISPTFQDIWGKHNEVPDASLVALLAELGVDAADTARAAQAEQALRAARRDERLPPVIVVAADAPDWSAPVQAPAQEQDTGRALRWALELESGERHAGSLPAEATTLAPSLAHAPPRPSRHAAQSGTPGPTRVH